MSANNDSEKDTYSDYEMVSQMITARVRDAITAYTELNQSETAGVKLSRADRTLYRADILAAAWLMEAELEAEARRNRSHGYADETLEKWRGDGGWLKKFATADRVMQYGWVGEFVNSIRRAAWEMGYLKTGSAVAGDDDDGGGFEEVEAIIEGMQS